MVFEKHAESFLGFSLALLLCAIALVVGLSGMARSESTRSDRELLSALNQDAPGLDAVKSAMQSNDLTRVKAAYLDYRRSFDSGNQ